MHVRAIIPAQLLLWILMLTILAGPLPLMRYVYPITGCLPLLISLLFKDNKRLKKILEIINGVSFLYFDY
jgi:hypothetical protein